MAAATTGTVYALVDPRDDRTRYIGATTKPLKVRLNGHLKGPAARRVKAWIDELAADGLVPRIEPITDGVAADDLRDVERTEITRRLIAGEQLLNESATAPARRQIERQRELDRKERERAAWEHAAHQVRAAVGGPLPPGPTKPIPLDSQSVSAHRKVLRVMDGPEDDGLPRDRSLSKATRLELARARASETLWRQTGRMWGSLRGIGNRRFDNLLAACVGTVVTDRWSDPDAASRYLALLPWGIMAVGPWAALAERAGLDACGEDFINWVSDDSTVREALMVLLLRSDGRMGPLSALDDDDSRSRPSTGLVAMTAAQLPGFDLPHELNGDVELFLASLLRDGQATHAMADLLLRLNHRALDNVLGPDIVSDIDVQLGLPKGTSCNVLSALVQRHNRGHHLGHLDRIVARACGAFPTVDTLSFAGWYGDTVPMFRAIAATLAAAGLLPAPATKTVADWVAEVRDLWSADLTWLERSA